MNWKLLWQTLAISALAGSAKAATITIGGATPNQKLDWKAVGNSALVGALLGALAFLAQPTPGPAVPPASAGPAGAAS